MGPRGREGGRGDGRLRPRGRGQWGATGHVRRTLHSRSRVRAHAGAKPRRGEPRRKSRAGQKQNTGPSAAGPRPTRAHDARLRLRLLGRGPRRPALPFARPGASPARTCRQRDKGRVPTQETEMSWGLTGTARVSQCGDVRFSFFLWDGKAVLYSDAERGEAGRLESSLKGHDGKPLCPQAHVPGPKQGGPRAASTPGAGRGAVR